MFVLRQAAESVVCKKNITPLPIPSLLDPTDILKFICDEFTMHNVIIVFL